ncbi:hypothetical protein [Stakelama marina]|uniref:Tetratricopeptide repeat protein n=1 Tax=Stakelama marina TaxID=2826939 RepID=A0A8T4I7F1_9SPHN|nr:hypothetical protein [Stakelama marina]MBR0550918.1 hypothetical protein [Stakelama marina]
MRTILLVSSAWLALTSAAPATAPNGDHASGHQAPSSPAQSQGAGKQVDHAPSVALPGFAASLANAPMIEASEAWKAVPYRDAWRAIARSTPGTRQQARWRYASSLIGSGDSADALGVLTVMAKDDPDLELVPAYQLALGAALVGLGRTGDALAALSGDRLVDNPEACAWRLRTLGEAGMGSDALMQWSCARTAIASRPRGQRAPFLIAAARAALDAHRPARTLALLNTLADSDPAVNLLRGRAYLALGQEQEARLRLDRVEDNGTPFQAADARISMIEGRVAHGHGAPRDMLKQLDKISYGWRGGKLEERALRLRYRLAGKLEEDRAVLQAGATLFRYFPASTDSGALLSSLQDRLAGILAPDSKLALPEAAGLFWNYRDLTPAGARGDLLVSQLADRLQAARLYKRAAELLDYQLTARLKDVAQGPLSVRVAKLYILAGEPDEALHAIRDTDGNVYPDDMRWSRNRVEAVALNQLGRTEEALATLEGVPDGDAIRDEIEWRRRNWKALAEGGEITLPKAGKLSDVSQAIILRRAVALAMLGRESGLAGLRDRYGKAFAGLSTAPAFDLLTGPLDALNPDTVAGAMAAIPTASPAGDIADLLAIDPAAVQLASK